MQVSVIAVDLPAGSGCVNKRALNWLAGSLEYICLPNISTYMRRERVVQLTRDHLMFFLIMKYKFRCPVAGHK